MERRQLIALATVAVPMAGVALKPSLVHAQGSEIERVMDEIVTTEAWLNDPSGYFRHTWGAYIYADLVDYFGAPAGRVPAGSSNELLRRLLPGQFDGWLEAPVRRVYDLVRNDQRMLTLALVELHDRNSSVFDAWLASVGIVPSGPVARMLLSGQVLATIVSLTKDETRGSDFISRIQNLRWWFFPFC